ncbi:MAG: hypothetical protein QGG90_06130, partial [Nitrospinota bacterium]|nr:hypothetical protein [Nitrospinota bacterium]
MIIDVHTHYFPEKYLDLVEREGSAYGVELTRDAEGERELRLQAAVAPRGEVPPQLLWRETTGQLELADQAVAPAGIDTPALLVT